MTEQERALLDSRRALLEDAEKNVARLKVLVHEAELKVERAKQEPEEPLRNSVIKFTVQFRDDGDVYNYVAYRAPNGKWYLTNIVGQHTWSDIVGTMLKDQAAKREGIRFFLYPPKASKGRWVGRQE